MYLYEKAFHGLTNLLTLSLSLKVVWDTSRWFGAVQFTQPLSEGGLEHWMVMWNTEWWSEASEGV